MRKIEIGTGPTRESFIECIDNEKPVTFLSRFGTKVLQICRIEESDTGFSFETKNNVSGFYNPEDRYGYLEVPQPAKYFK